MKILNPSHIVSSIVGGSAAQLRAFKARVVRSVSEWAEEDAKRYQQRRRERSERPPQVVTAYVNKPTRQVTVHRPGCSRIGQHGGGRGTKNGYYLNFASSTEARRHAAQMHYKFRGCSWC